MNPLRMVHRARAWLLGYFWRPCAACGRMFGGHQWGDRWGHCSDYPTSDGDVSMICPRCTMAGVGCRAWARDGRKAHVGCSFTR